jgi:hypothetical protein
MPYVSSKKDREEFKLWAGTRYQHPTMKNGYWVSESAWSAFLLRGEVQAASQEPRPAQQQT